MELSKEFELRQKTCWEFKWKIQQAMQSSKKYPLEGEIHVDEFLLAGLRKKNEVGVKGKSGFYLHHG